MNGTKKRELKEYIGEVEETASNALSIARADSEASIEGKIKSTEDILQQFIKKGKSDEACNEDEELLIKTIELLKEEKVDVFYPSTSILKPTTLEIATLHQTVYLNEYIKENPTTKQIEALLCKNLEALYGGQVGGGKSSYLLMFLLQYVKVRNYQCAVFRKSFMDLSQPGGLIPRSKDWLSGTDAKYNASEHQWSFPKYTSVLKFGYLDSENDCYRYQGGEYQRIGFDEVPHIRPFHYEYLFSRKRRLKGSIVPTQVRSTANPDGPNYSYIKDRFVKPGHPDRPFIRSRLEDNRYLDIEDYESGLKVLDDVTYRKLRYGDWEVQPAGRMFKGEWFINKKIDAYEVPINALLLRAWDLAASKPTVKNKDPDWTVGTKYAIDLINKRIIIVNQVAIREDPGETEDFIRATAIADGYSCEQWFEIEGGATGKSYQKHLEKNILPDFICKGERPSTNKEARAKPLAAACKRGDVYLVIGDYIDPMLDQWCTFPDSDHKDRTDSASLGYKRAAQIYSQHFTGKTDENVEEEKSQPHDPKTEKLTDFQILEKQILTKKQIDISKITDFDLTLSILEEISRKYIDKNDSGMVMIILDEIDRIEKYLEENK
jgi:predicted phage terminase large subunit-like protein